MRLSDYESMEIKNSFVLCRRGQSHILLAIDGTEYPIKFNGALRQYGETVIGVTPIEEKYIGKYGFERTRTNYEVSIFKKSMMLSKFIYKESSVYHENFDLINENTIWVWHWGKYGKFGTRINLKGEHVSCAWIRILMFSGSLRYHSSMVTA